MTQATSPVAEDENQAPVPDEQGKMSGAEAKFAFSTLHEAPSPR
jgi:hypothetical protein